MAPNTPSEIAIFSDPLALLSLNNLASLKEGGAYIHSLQEVKGNFAAFETEERIINGELKLQPLNDSKIETTDKAYWDWPSEDPLGVDTVEKKLISDSNARKIQRINLVESFEASNEQYWDWNASTEPKVEDIVENLLKYERIRPTFSISNIEEILNNKVESSKYTQRSSKNALLSESSDYWYFSSEDIAEHNDTDAMEFTIKKNEKIVRILCAANVLNQLENAKSITNTRIEENKSEDSNNYWAWPAESTEKIKNEQITSLPANKVKISLESPSIDSDIEEIVRNNSHDEILNWILESRELGLIPSSEIFSQLLNSFRSENSVCDESELRSMESYWDERPEILTNFGNEYYWDEIPVSAYYEKPSYNENEIVGYWDERVSNELSEEQTQECYWDM